MKRYTRKSIPWLMLSFALSLSAAEAKPKGATNQAPKVDPVQTQNQRHKTHHADRKTAARHLRVKHQQEHQAELFNDARQHQGYSGRGRADVPKTGGAQ